MLAARRHSEKITVVVLVVLFVGICLTASNAEQSTGANTGEGRKLPLKEQLTLGLKATTKQDKEFIDTVVMKVDQGILPRALVDSTFLWARERANRKSATRSLRPIVYFRPGLIARAKSLRISL